MRRRLFLRMAAGALAASMLGEALMGMAPEVVEPEESSLVWDDEYHPWTPVTRPPDGGRRDAFYAYGTMYADFQVVKSDGTIVGIREA